jgi:hypothetical protein
MSEQTGEIYRLISKIMGEVGAISKGRKNQQQGYAFRGIDDVYHALQTPLANNGVFYIPKVIRREREERQTKSGGSLTYTTMDVEYTFYAPDGSCVTATTTGEAMDSGDKSSNKAMSAALKYALLQVFCIPTEEDNDTENSSPEPLPKKQVAAKPAPAQGKGVVTPAPAPEVHEKRMIQLDELMDSLGIEGKVRTAYVAAVCTKYKVTRITELPQEKWDAMIESIKKDGIAAKKAA